MPREPRSRPPTHQISGRLSADSYELLLALRAVTGESQMRVIERALGLLEQSLDPTDRQFVAMFVKRRTTRARKD